MIRKATQEDIDAILHITQQCAIHMMNRNIFQWNEHYPNRKAFINDVNREELYVLEFEEMIIGCMVISTLKDDEYIPIKWLTDTDNAVYIHRLAIQPVHQGKGCAQQLMDFAETLALESNFNSVRLDTFSQNKRNQAFYESRGYQRLESIYFPKQSEHPFYCYELLLK